jgi:tRNA (guanine-N(7)-)-methyltransferase subunit TRM82
MGITGGVEMREMKDSGNGDMDASTRSIILVIVFSNLSQLSSHVGNEPTFLVTTGIGGILYTHTHILITIMAELPYPLVGAVSTDSSILLASNSSIHLIAPTASSSASTQTYTLPPSSPSAFIRQLAISPDSAYAATVSDDKGLRVYSLATSPITLLSTRYLTKKSSCLSFTQDNNVLVSDKVGDCYLYPLEARAVSAEKLKKLDVQADPTLNPEADYLLGHVSVLTSHILPEPEQDGRRYLITADRDEHIRITRYPDTFVIERYMFGTEGFISSMHIPEGHPELLISGGGEGVLRIWNWKLGKQVGSIDIQGDVLLYRKARSTLRKDKRKGKSGKKGPEAEGTEASAEEEGKVKDFYDVPAGWMLPSGMGVLIKEITSLRIADSLVVLFYSEG